MGQVTVETSNDLSQQVISLSTECPAGRLLLHWGVEGGKDYKGGWRLPGAPVRPEGTVQYKDRALQSPFRCAPVCVVCATLCDFPVHLHTLACWWCAQQHQSGFGLA